MVAEAERLGWYWVIAAVGDEVRFLDPWTGRRDRLYIGRTSEELRQSARDGSGQPSLEFETW